MSDYTETQFSEDFAKACGLWPVKPADRLAWEILARAAYRRLFFAAAALKKAKEA